MRSAWLMIVAVCVALVGGGSDTRLELRTRNDQRVSRAHDLALAVAARRDTQKTADRGTCGSSTIVPQSPAIVARAGLITFLALLAPASSHPQTVAPSRTSRGPPLG